MDFVVSDLVALFLAVVVLALKPGPYMLAFTSMAMDGRVKSMLVFWLGFVTAGTILYFVLLWGMSFIPEDFGLLFMFVKAFAAVIFINLGINSLKDTLEVDQKAGFKKAEEISTQNILKNLLSGFFLTLSNPFDIIFVLTIIPALIGTLAFSFSDVLVIRGVVVGADVLVLLSYCLPILFFRNFLSKNVLKKLRVFSSWAMILIGLYLLGNMLFTQFDLYQTGLLGVEK